MEPAPIDARLGEQILEAPRLVGRAERRALLCREYQVELVPAVAGGAPLLILLLPMAAQIVDQRRRQVQRPATAVGLGRHEAAAPVDQDHVLPVPNWDTTPDNTSTYDLVAPPGWSDPYGLLGRGTYAYVGLAYTQAEAANLNTSTILDRLGAWAGSGVNTVLGAFRALANKAAGISTPSDLTSGGGTFSNQTDSVEAIRDYTAAQADVLAITNNTRVVRVVPPVMERPDSGSTVFRIELLLYDEVGNMEAPDSAPAISVVDESGSSRDANLDSTTMTLVSTGRYRSTYSVGTGHDIEELIFAFSVVESSATRVYANAALVVDTTAVDFTASDRADLQAILADTADMQPKQGTPVTTLAGDLAAQGTLIDAIKAKTDGLSFSGADVKATLDGETVVLTDGSLTAAKIASGAISAAKFAADACNKIADHVLRRKSSSAEGSSDGDSIDDAASLYGMIQQHRQADTTTNTSKLTIFKTDGTTELEQLDLATDPAADPVTGIS